MSFRDSISGPFAKIVVGPQAEEFLVQKALLCDSSDYFFAALNSQSIEGRTQKIVLHNEDAEVFRTFVAWLYQGHLTCSEIRKMFDKKSDFEDHITAILLFADRRNIPKLTDDATTLLLDFLEKTGLAQPLTIDRVFLLPDDIYRRMLLLYFVADELYFGYRIESDTVHELDPAFVIAALRESLGPREKEVRNYPSTLSQRTFCRSYHKHPEGEKCFSRALNIYDGPVTVQRPDTSAESTSKKRKAVQTSGAWVEVDGVWQRRRRGHAPR